MLSKLLKYDIRATWKSVMPLSLVMAAVIFVSCGAIVGINICQGAENVLNAVMMSGMTVILVLSVLTVPAFTLLISFFSYYRYYKNLFTDEGYLTFTLPVNTDCIIGAKLLNALIWNIYAIACIGVWSACVSICFMLTSPVAGGFMEQASGIVGWAVDYLVNTIAPTKLISTGADAVFGIVIVYLAITIGAVTAKKHKVLAAIGMFLLISFSISTLSGMISALIAVVCTTMQMSVDTISLITDFSGIIISLAALAAGYFINRRLLKTRLNLV